MSNTILRLPAVKARTGLSRSTIYLRIASGMFPTPVPLGARAVGWIESEIEQWLLKQIECSRPIAQATISQPNAHGERELWTNTLIQKSDR
jgi:prophage regulatory protein